MFGEALRHPGMPLRRRIETDREMENESRSKFRNAETIIHVGILIALVSVINVPIAPPDRDRHHAILRRLQQCRVRSGRVIYPAGSKSVRDRGERVKLLAKRAERAERAQQAQWG